MDKRSSGILMHITSLPSPCGVGDMGPGAYLFANFLAEAKQGYWEVLPLNPTDPAHGNSPYASVSTFAGNPLLISPERLVEENFISRQDIEPFPAVAPDRVDYAAAGEYKRRIVDIAFRKMKERNVCDCDYEEFCAQNALWLDNFALFKGLKERFNGRPWDEWPPELRDRAPAALEEARRQLRETTEREKYTQYLFFRQWSALKNYCNGKGIQIVGDLPIYVNYDSVEAWTWPQIFKLNDDKKPCCVAGVPPDYFSKTGQLWGNPVYRWDVLKETGYQWWIRRLEHTFGLFNVVRIDHFRGLVAFWEVPYGEKTAVRGRWVQAPAVDFFNTLLKYFVDLNIVVEDLGTITPDVREVVQMFGFPGMKVLLFAFGEDDPRHPYLPHNYEENYVAYTGTHDTNTVRGWFEHETTPEQRQRLFRYVGRSLSAADVPWEMMRLLMMSRADVVMVPMQDVLGLGQEARMNTPSVSGRNWEWRLSGGQLTHGVAGRLGEMSTIYGRT